MNKMIWLAVYAAPLFIQPVLGQDSTQQQPTQQQTPTQQPARRGGFGQLLERVLSAGSTGTTGSGLTNSDIATGLREALRVGISKGADQASATDGYFKNPLLRIAFPPEAQRVATQLRQLGFNRQVDQFELSLNRAAEDAAKVAKPVFIKAITSMSIGDAVGILRGSEDAATQYLRRTSGQQLVTEFTPIIDSTLRKNNATRMYGNLANMYNRLPGVQRVNPNLTEYATNKAVDGLFILVAQEEKQIREDPAARVSDILRRVFGSR
ncbi:DUF4197 domain-containing protein [Spirosoma montaniterrae]|uniref:DUF4197 domain-containing protein n=1 Tax=Spirosoma montaniterrae TaxID=1178516 RepID=A0A1P9WWQ3_9BACT|nr:DUF4197 domain-containing protein [Spirosoma montaniterrae]AQG79783.1 hypothetical protein AWR27_10875 [Spirosoma montaniterrae]